MKAKTLIVTGFWIVATLCGCAAPSRPSSAANYVAGNLVQLNDHSAWSWFSEPRAIIQNGKVIVGSVRSIGLKPTVKDDPRWGNVEITVYDINTGQIGKTVMHEHFQHDDHDDPAFLVLPDNRILATYSMHGRERKVYVRISKPNDPLSWSDAQVIVTPGVDARPLKGDNATYSNLFRFPNGRIYDFYRGFGYDPNYMFSDDDGKTWQYGGRVLEGKTGYGPYVKYAYDGHGTLHVIATEDHPRNFDNSLYHGTIHDGQIFDSYGHRLAELSHTTDANIKSWDLTKIFSGDPDNVAWMCDIRLDREKHPYIAFSVQKDGRDKPVGQGGLDHRFYYGRFDGSAWHVNEIAYAGTRLYPREDDYTGLVALRPNNPNVLYISTNADPVTGKPLISTADNQRHRELFRGRTSDGGKTWKWTALTANSSVDNMRPMVPVWNDHRTVLIWMRGGYASNYGKWDTSAVLMILPNE